MEGALADNGQPIDFLAMLRAPKVAASIGRSSSNARPAPTLRCVWSPYASPNRPPHKHRKPAGCSARSFRFPRNPRCRRLGHSADLPPTRRLLDGRFLDLYRLRWRIELGFKRLKSLIGLKEPPGFDERSASLPRRFPTSRRPARYGSGARPGRRRSNAPWALAALSARRPSSPSAPPASSRSAAPRQRTSARTARRGRSRPACPRTP